MTSDFKWFARQAPRRTLAMLLLAGCVGLSWAETVPVRTLALGELLLRQEHSALATVEALNRSRLSAEISARVEAIPVRVGDPVSRGQLLLRLDCRNPESALAAARAALAESAARRVFAENQLSRALDLKRQRNISEELAQQRQSELDVLRAQSAALAESVRQAEISVDRCNLVAPFDAWVRARLVSLGELASPGQALLDLVQRDAREVSAQLRDSDAREVAEAERLWFEYAGQRFAVKLRRLLPLIDGVARTREARFEFGGDAAPPGAAGRLVWESRAAFLPAEYLTRRGDQLGVFVADGDTARFQRLPGAVEGQPARVDLPLSTRVVTEGRQIVNDGDRLSLD